MYPESYSTPFHVIWAIMSPPLYFLIPSFNIRYMFILLFSNSVRCVPMLYHRIWQTRTETKNETYDEKSASGTHFKCTLEQDLRENGCWSGRKWVPRALQLSGTSPQVRMEWVLWALKLQWMHLVFCLSKRLFEQHLKLCNRKRCR